MDKRLDQVINYHRALQHNAKLLGDPSSETLLGETIKYLEELKEIKLREEG